MPTYWLYRLDPYGGLIEPGSNYHCEDDEEAVILAEMFRADEVQVEIRREAVEDRIHRRKRG